jgi:hypothetical protein
MSTAAQLFGAFFILCAIGAIGTLLASKRWSSIVLAAIGSLSAILILLTSALLLVGDTSFRAELWPALLAGNNGIGGGSPFRAVPVDSWVGVSTGVNLLRCLPGPKALQPAVFRRAVSCPVRIGRADPYTNDAISFLVSWEIMSIASYLLVNFEYEHDESSHAGFMMLAMSEAGTISVAIAFTLAAGWRRHLRVRSDTICREGIGWAVFLLSFFGFAVKAGLVPVNSWLPLAHPRTNQCFYPALGCDRKSGHLRYYAIQSRPAARDGKRAGLDRTHRRQHFRGRGPAWAGGLRHL